MALALTACGHKLREGEVTGKEHQPAYTTMILMPMTISTGKASTTTFVPMFFFYPESWAVKIKAYDGHVWQTATWWVSQSVYDQVRVGGYFVAKDPSCTDERPRERVHKP
jgi:hypothetical protein